MCSRPAVSTRTTSRWRALPAAIASNTTAAGSAPARARMMSTPARVAQTSSCSTAAARNVSAAQISGALPESLIRRASLPTVVVLPVPFTPTISTTCGRCPLRRGALDAAQDLEDLRLDQLAQRLPARLAAADRLDDPVRSPPRRRRRKSALLRAPRRSRRRSAAPRVRSRRRAAPTSSNRSTNCSFVRVSDCLILSKNPMVNPVYCQKCQECQDAKIGGQCAGPG